MPVHELSNQFAFPVSMNIQAPTVRVNVNIQSQNVIIQSKIIVLSYIELREKENDDDVHIQ